MKKRLNVESIKNELNGGSAFFPNYVNKNSPAPKPQPESTKSAHQTAPTAALASPIPDNTIRSAAPPLQKETRENPTPDTVIPRHHDTMQPRYHDTMIPVSAENILEVVRKAVKHIGKEAATHRFTLDEKNHLADIEYTYKRQGIKTSENEITRIAINYFVEDYRKNGEQSLLAKILKRINS